MYQPERYLDIPRTDLLSWTFGNTNYDQDKPVKRIAVAPGIATRADSANRFTLTRTTTPRAFPIGKQNLL